MPPRSIVDLVIAPVAVDAALSQVLRAHMMSAEAAHVEGPEVESRLALDDPFRHRLAGAAGRRDARGEATGDVDVVAFRSQTHDRLAVG